jgi:hypothetical protein
MDSAWYNSQLQLRHIEIETVRNKYGIAYVECGIVALEVAIIVPEERTLVSVFIHTNCDRDAGRGTFEARNQESQTTFKLTRHSDKPFKGSDCFLHSMLYILGLSSNDCRVLTSCFESAYVKAVVDSSNEHYVLLS